MTPDDKRLDTMKARKKAKASSLKKINEILAAGYAETLRDMTARTTIQCGSCHLNFIFNCTPEDPKIDYGVISNAHGVVHGYQFKFACPNCGVLLRVDEDEIELRVFAKPAIHHS